MGRSMRFVCAGTALLLAVACNDQGSAPTGPQAGGAASFRTAFSGPPEVLRNAIIHRTVEAVAGARRGPPGSSGSKELAYRGGVGGVGVETAPKVYLVLWGSQWNSNDPSNESGILQSFFSGVGGSPWLNSVTQYCQNVPSATVFCNLVSTAIYAGNQTSILGGVWYDNATAAPTRPKQSAIAAEAVRAAGHWGNGATANENAQYVIATATGNNSSGFGTQYCAYHSYTSSTTTGNVAYTNLPYITDAGANCGANFNSLGPTAGITIVEGHELAETVTDQFPSGGWLDSNGAENGDKCAWISSGQGAAAAITISTGTYPVQSLWSNAFNSNSGGCVLSYPT